MGHNQGQKNFYRPVIGGRTVKNITRNNIPFTVAVQYASRPEVDKMPCGKSPQTYRQA